MDQVTIERQIIIRGCALGRVPWHIQNAELIQGRDFVTLRRDDTGLCKLILCRSQKNRDHVY